MPTRSELMGALRNAHEAGDTEAAKRIAVMVRDAPEDAPKYGLRVDGTPKGTGFFGLQKMTDGSNRDMTEFSIGVDFGQGETEIPTLVPTLTPQELDFLKAGNAPSQAIIDKALDHAEQRIANNRSPFIEQGESETPQQAPSGPGFFDLFTGESRMTPEIAELEEIQRSPEVGSDLSPQGFKIAFGLLSTTDPEEQKAILRSQLGDQVSFSKDAKGNDIVTLPSGRFALNAPGLTTRDIMPAIMDVLSFTPAGRATSIPGAVAKSAGTEALLESGEAAVGGEFDEVDVAMAGGLSGIFKGAENLIGAGYRALKGPLTDDIVEAGTDAGIPILTSDVRQPKTFVGRSAQQIGEKIPIAGTGPVRETQQAARQAAVADVAERYQQFSYEAIVDSLKTQKDKVKNAAGSVLENTGNKLDGFGEIPLTNTQAAIDKASGELSKAGVIKSSQAIDDLNVLIDSMGEATQTFTSLKENRTAFREIIAGADKAERSQLTSRAKGLLQNVESGIKKDMDAFAKENLTPQEYSKWQRANKVYASEARNLTKTRLKSVLDQGDVKPEVVKNMLLSQNPSEVRLLYKSLTADGRRNARAAIISESIGNLSRRQSGFTPDAFESEMKKRGLQVNEFFKGEEKRQLAGLLKALEATRRAQAAAVTTPTGQATIPLITGLLAYLDPVTTLGAGGSIGIAARLYESPAVRNALLRLDSLPRGSTRFEQALGEWQSIMSSTAQSLRDEQSGTQ